MAGDIELQIENKHFHKSNLILKSIDKVVIQYDSFNPTRGGSYIKLPEWIASKKPAEVLRSGLMKRLNLLEIMQ